MPIEFIGMIGTRPASELNSPTVSITGGSVNPDYVRKFAKVHEDGGFDPVEDAIAYGRDVIGLVRTAVQKREQLVARARS